MKFDSIFSISALKTGHCCVLGNKIHRVFRVGGWDLTAFQQYST